MRRTARVVVLAAGVVAFGSGCSPDSDASADTIDVATVEANEALARDSVAPFIGQTLAEFKTNATALGYTVQTTYINEGGFGEYQPKRIRVLVEDGDVIEVVSVG